MILEANIDDLTGEMAARHRGAARRGRARRLGGADHDEEGPPGADLCRARARPRAPTRRRCADAPRRPTIGVRRSRSRRTERPRRIIDGGHAFGPSG